MLTFVLKCGHLCLALAIQIASSVSSPFFFFFSLLGSLFLIHDKKNNSDLNLYNHYQVINLFIQFQLSFKSKIWRVLICTTENMYIIYNSLHLKAFENSGSEPLVHSSNGDRQIQWNLCQC
jgi:outer membrane phospholipase A